MFGVLEEEEGRKANEIFRVIISVISGYSLSSKQENSFGPAPPVKPLPQKILLKSSLLYYLIQRYS